MKRKYKIMNNSLSIFILFSLFLLELTNGHPIEKVTAKPTLPKDETRYSNGTIIGKYMYTDHEGNPIHVKYYADDGSYGVELQRLKIAEANTNDPNTPLLPKTTMEIAKPSDSPFGLEIGNYDLAKPYYRNKYKSNDKYLKNKSRNDKKHAKSGPEYEVFYHNNLPLQDPSPCGNDKVKIYLDNHDRITRNIEAVDYAAQAAKYCEQF